jgi:hypothetical protein
MKAPWAWAGVVSSAALVGWLTLGGAPADGGGVCLAWCGGEALADALANVVLFVPLGVALTAALASPRRAVAWALLLSCLIEVIQLDLPGRYASPGDVATTALGAVLGAAAWRSAPRWLLPPPPRRTWYAAGAAVVAVAVVSLTAALLEPSVTGGRFWGQWTAHFGGMAAYDGHLDSVKLGGVTARSTRLPDTLDVRERLRAGGVDLWGRAGPAPAGLAPLFSVSDRERRFILLVGADGPDLVYRYRMRAADLRLREPELRVPGLLLDVRAGDPLHVRTARERSGLCAAVEPRVACGRRFSIGSGWSFVFLLPRETASLSAVVSCLWLSMLLLPLGFWATGRTGVLLVGAALIPLVLVPRLSSAVETRPTDVVGVVAGLSAGALLRLGCRFALRDRPPSA